MSFRRKKTSVPYPCLKQRGVLNFDLRANTSAISPVFYHCRLQGGGGPNHNFQTTAPVVISAVLPDQNQEGLEIQFTVIISLGISRRFRISIFGSLSSSVPAFPVLRSCFSQEGFFRNFIGSPMAEPVYPCLSA